MRIFQELNAEGTTILMITHESEVSLYTKRILTFNDGALVDDQPQKSVYKGAFA